MSRAPVKAYGKAQVQHDNSMQTSYHDSDRLATKNSSEAELLPDRCPDCGKTVYQNGPAIRPAIKKEVQDLLRARGSCQHTGLLNGYLTFPLLFYLILF